MTIRVNYTGQSTARVIKRTDFTGAGLPDPGADLVWNKANGYQQDLPNLTAAWLLAQGDFAAASGLGFGDFFASSPIRSFMGGGSNINVGVVANTWHDCDPTGSAAARPSDIVIPNVTAGQWVCVSADFISNATSTAYVSLDLWTIVSSVAVHQFGEPANGSLAGIPAWVMPGSTYIRNGAAVWYQVQQSDIENGSVRIRLRDFNAATTARVLIGTAGFHIALVGTGPFG